MELNHLEEIKKNFISDLSSAKDNQSSSLPFILNQLPKQPVVKPGQKFQVMSIGGTNYKTAIMSVDQDANLTASNVTSEQSREPFKTKEDFVTYVLDRVHGDTEFLAINFAFPLNPEFRNGMLEGALAQPTKNDLFEGLVGIKIGELLEEELRTKVGRSINISLANDTICLLLAGSVQYSREELGAGIVGTGYNAAFFVDNEHAVNLEAASFSNFDMSETGKIVDQNAVNKGSEFEKETSGAYLYQHFNLTEGISAKISSTEELDAIAKDESHPDKDKARALLEHSAQLVATQIAGILDFNERDMHFVMEGSLFWKAWNYKEMVEEWIQKLSPNRKVDFFQVDDSELYGAAKLIS